MAIASRGGDKVCFYISRDQIINESRDSVGKTPSHQITKIIVIAIELNNKNIYTYYKLGETCVTNWAALSYYKLRQTLFQTGEAITI